MKKKDFMKLLATALTVAVCFSGINFSPMIQGREVVAAKEQEEVNYQKYLQDTKVEIKEERTKDSNTYQLADGSKELVIYTEPIRYEDDQGNLIDYDASLKEISHTDEKSRSKNERKGYLYENTQGDMKNYIPEHVSEDTPILMEKDEMAIRISPVTSTKINAFSKTKEFQSADEIMQEVETIYEKKATDHMGVSYETAAQEMELQYYSFASGIKEAIVLNEKPDSNAFSFRLDLQGLTPRLNELIGSVELIGDDGKTVEAFIEAPFMNDATDTNYSEDLYYEIEANADGSYQLILTVDQEYLDTAEYPVEIDPTTTWGTDPVIHDAYVIKGATYGDTNFFSDSISVQCTGNASQGTMRQYMMMMDFYVILKGYCVTSAKLYLYESGAYTAGNTIQVRYPTTPWSLYTLTWNNQPICSAPIATATTEGKLNSEVVLDITTYARGLAAGTLRNYGIMYHNVNESSGFNKFYGARNSVTSKRPKLVVNYVDGPTAPSAVSISPTYVKPGGQFTYTWSGINTSYLSYVQYRTADSSGTDLVHYTTYSKIGTTSSGTKVFTVPSNWSDGTYTTYVRGVDSGGIAGGEKGATFVLDGTAPTLSVNVGGSPSGSGSGLGFESSGALGYTSLPFVNASAQDANFKEIVYSVNGSETWRKLATLTPVMGSLSAEDFPTAGTYTIEFRAYDKAGNYASETVMYEYAPVAPNGLTATINHAGTAVVGNTNTPTLSWSGITADSLRSVEYSVNGGDYIQAGSTKSGSIQMDSSLFLTDGTYNISVRAVNTAGMSSSEVSLVYTYDTTAAHAFNISLSKTDSGVRIYLRNTASSDLDTTMAYYAVVPVGQVAPEASAYSEAETVSYENNTMIIDVPISAVSADEGVYMVYAALKDTAGNIGYSNPSVKSWYNINAVYDGTLIVDATQKLDSAETPTDQWYLTWEIGNTQEDDADEIITTADVYESRDGAAFEKLGTSTDGQMLMTLPDINSHAIYRIVATYQDGSKKISDVTSIKKSEKEVFVEETEADWELELTEEESAELINLCAVAVETVPINDRVDRQTTGDVEITTVDYIYASEDIDTDSDGLLDGYEIWELSSYKNGNDTDCDGFDDYYEVTVLGTDPVIYTADADDDGDGVFNISEYANGTNPYLPDSDFDGINDGNDADPLKTDTSSSASITYDVAIHEGLFDVRDTYSDNEYKVRNIYSNVIKTAVTGSDYIRYYHDKDGNNTATITMADGQYVLDTAYFDAYGNMTFLTHNGLGYTFAYSDDNLTSVAVNGQNLVSYSYTTGADDTVLQSGITYANGGKEEYSYTDMSITPTIENDDGTTSTETSAQSMLTDVAVDGEAAFSYNYDSEGNVTKLTDIQNGVTYNYSYTDGVLASVTGSNGFSISYQQTDERNEDSKLAKYTNTSNYTVNGTTKSLVHSYENTNTDNNNYTSQSSLTSGGTVNVTVTEDGNVHAETLKNSSGTQIAGRTTTISEDTTSIVYVDGSSLIYVYDDDGNISQIKGKKSASATETVLQSYTYDAFGQLTAENDAENNRSATFTYDLNGNILSKVETVNGTSTTHTYQYGNSQWRDLLTAYDGDAITYDAGGNPLTYRDGITFTWKNGRQLASYEDSSYRITYDYNDSGIRVKKTVTEKSKGTVTVTENYLEDTSVVAQKITTTPLGGTASTEIIWYIYDGTGTVVGMQTEDGTYYYEKNLQGDITAIVNESGTEVVSYSYDVWENVISAEDTSGVQLVEKNPFTYRGYYRDNETGFYYLQSRFFDPEINRFINADNVIGESNTSAKDNLFTYCGNSPVDMVDYDGHIAINVVCAAIGAIAGVAFGKWIANKLGYKSGWKYWAIRSGVVIGGAVIGWFAGSLIIKLVSAFLVKSPTVLFQLSTKMGSIKFVATMKLLGINPIKLVPKAKFIPFLKIFNNKKISIGVNWSKSLVSQAKKYGYILKIHPGHGRYSQHLHVFTNKGKKFGDLHIQVTKDAYKYLKTVLKGD